MSKKRLSSCLHMELEYHVVGERFEKEWMNEGKDN